MVVDSVFMLITYGWIGAKLFWDVDNVTSTSFLKRGNTFLLRLVVRELIRTAIASTKMTRETHLSRGWCLLLYGGTIFNLGTASLNHISIWAVNLGTGLMTLHRQIIHEIDPVTMPDFMVLVPGPTINILTYLKSLTANTTLSLP